MAEALRDLVLWLHTMLPVDPCRTYLTGNSMGGYGAWELARVYPDLFAALCVTCGHYEPCSVERLARLVETLRRAKMPVWIFHGREDDVCVFSEIEELFRLLSQGQEQSSLLRMTTEGIVGHDAWTVGYSAESGVFEWMLQHCKSGNAHSSQAKMGSRSVLQPQESLRAGGRTRGRCPFWCSRRQTPRDTE
eukprot:TRINITY_DN58688_c0_g1_i1.p1 TRINITY_DN58688_c0_g1~~TRINITY_DN58688_c0_g1_i1.p1  ORF type:complete len:217 (+),score=20.54 TRINITY_DN58688_c0_g1_i1:80-652(+)